MAANGSRMSANQPSNNGNNVQNPQRNGRANQDAPRPVWGPNGRQLMEDIVSDERQQQANEFLQQYRQAIQRIDAAYSDQQDEQDVNEEGFELIDGPLADVQPPQQQQQVAVVVQHAPPPLQVIQQVPAAIPDQQDDLYANEEGFEVIEVAQVPAAIPDQQDVPPQFVSMYPNWQELLNDSLSDEQPPQPLQQAAAVVQHAPPTLQPTQPDAAAIPDKQAEEHANEEGYELTDGSLPQVRPLQLQQLAVAAEQHVPPPPLPTIQPIAAAIPVQQSVAGEEEEMSPDVQQLQQPDLQQQPQQPHLDLLPVVNQFAQLQMNVEEQEHLTLNLLSKRGDEGSDGPSEKRDKDDGSDTV